uniref:Uncharacterized protein n=1 Tax=Sphaerodactylus townsendi TaxID=933632 RepID=A0ACB8ESI9_9SAUR
MMFILEVSKAQCSLTDYETGQKVTSVVVFLSWKGSFQVVVSCINTAVMIPVSLTAVVNLQQHLSIFTLVFLGTSLP